MDVTEEHARQIVGDYVNFGNAENFESGELPISAFLFTRKQLNDLIKDDQEDEIFIMLAIDAIGINPNKSLWLVLGSILNNFIDMGSLIVSDVPPSTTPISFDNNSVVKRPVSEPILLQDLRRMHNIFTSTPSDTSLTSSKGHKIKAYNLNRNDLDMLDLTDTVNSSNENDCYAFIPVIRENRTRDNAPFDRNHLSLAIARIDADTMVVSGTILEYCLPCPNACATNYWFK